MKPPANTQLDSMVKSTLKGKYIEVADEKQFLIKILTESQKAEENSLRLKCLQTWIREIKKSTDEFNRREYGLASEMTPNPSAAKSAP